MNFCTGRWREIVSGPVSNIALLSLQVAADCEVANNPEHEMRRRFDAATDEFISKLETSTDFHDQAELLKQELLEHLELEAYVLFRIVSKCAGTPPRFNSSAA